VWRAPPTTLSSLHPDQLVPSPIHPHPLDHSAHPFPRATPLCLHRPEEHSGATKRERRNSGPRELLELCTERERRWRWQRERRGRPQRGPCRPEADEPPEEGASPA
jgi:hypothetical protein